MLVFCIDLHQHAAAGPGGGPVGAAARGFKYQRRSSYSSDLELAGESSSSSHVFGTVTKRNWKVSKTFRSDSLNMTG